MVGDLINKRLVIDREYVGSVTQVTRGRTTLGLTDVGRRALSQLESARKRTLVVQA